MPHCPHLCSACYAQAKKIKSGIYLKFWVPKIEVFAAVTSCFHMSSGISATVVLSIVARICSQCIVIGTFCVLFLTCLKLLKVFLLCVSRREHCAHNSHGWY